MNMNLFDLINMLDLCLLQPQAHETCPSCAQTSRSAKSEYPKVLQGHWCPDIKRVTFNGNTTIVFFVDGTYSIVKLSHEDKYDKKTAVVYAIVKRMLGTLGKTDKNGKFHSNEVDGKGFGMYLQDIVDKGFDQELEEKTAAEKKRAAHAAHEARQEAQKNAAFKRRVEERAKQILLERAATDRANEIEDERRKAKKSSCNCDKSRSCSEDAYNGVGKKTCSDHVKLDPNDVKIDPHDEWLYYKKPNKPFSQFTDEEKKAYWRYHNQKRRFEKSKNN